jgi:hypothetical protein
LNNFAGQRTWQVHVNEVFLGYEYAAEESVVIEKTMRKFGSPALWGAEQYTVEKIKWEDEEDKV